MSGESLGDLPDRVEVSQTGGVPVLGYVGLMCGGDGVDVRLFMRPEEAELDSEGGSGGPTPTTF